MEELIEWLESQAKRMDYEISIEMDPEIKLIKQGVLMGYNSTLAHIRMNLEESTRIDMTNFFK